MRLVVGQTNAAVYRASLELTRKEALLLEQLLHGIGDGRRAVGEDALRAYMRNLRQKLTGGRCHPNLIETVYGVGYRLNPTVSC